MEKELLFQTQVIRFTWVRRALKIRSKPEQILAERILSHSHVYWQWMQINALHSGTPFWKMKTPSTNIAAWGPAGSISCLPLVIMVCSILLDWVYLQCSLPPVNSLTACFRKLGHKCLGCKRRHTKVQSWNSANPVVGHFWLHAKCLKRHQWSPGPYALHSQHKVVLYKTSNICNSPHKEKICHWWYALIQNLGSSPNENGTVSAYKDLLEGLQWWLEQKIKLKPTRFLCSSWNWQVSCILPTFQESHQRQDQKRG